MTDDKPRGGEGKTPQADGPSPAGSVIPFSRFRAQISRARTRPLALQLLDRPDIARYVPTMPVQELFYAIKEVGLSDAAELVQLASPEQVQGFLDLDAWHKTELRPERVAAWFELLVDAGPARLARAVEGLDPELIALYLQRQARIYDLNLDEVPEEPEGHFYPTPDTFYLLDVLSEGEAGKQVERFIDWLYRAHMDLARRVVMAARWEMTAELEEYAYRWRSGRMADLGHIEYYEALGVYEYLDPTSVKVGEGTADLPPEAGAGLPAEFAGALDDRGILARALEQITDPAELERLSGALLFLVNRVMSADLVEPGDLEGARAALQRTAAYLGLGLELLARNDPARAAEALRTVSLSRIFRVGFSLTAKLKQAADALVAEAWIRARPGEPVSLLDSPHAEVLRALHVARPQYARILDGGSGERPFATLAEIARAAEALAEVVHVGDMLRRGLGVDPRLIEEGYLEGCSPGFAELSFQVIAATIFANLLLDRPAGLVPLEPADLPVLRERALENGKLRPSARLAVQKGFEARCAERGYDPPAVSQRLIDAWLAHLEQALLLSAEPRSTALPGSAGSAGALLMRRKPRH